MGAVYLARVSLTRAAAAGYRYRVADRSRLSPGGAIVIGLLLGASGTFIVLMALGAFGVERLSAGTPEWVGVLAGLVFALAGLAVIVGYGTGGATADGELPPDAPFAVRLVQYLLGLGMTVSLALIGSWVAFGAGPRRFSGSGGLGGVGAGTAVGETLGRVAFGLGALVTWGIVILITVAGFKRLRR
jgi:hypothetical protein